jgi:hypothetical protein
VIDHVDRNILRVSRCGDLAVEQGIIGCRNGQAAIRELRGDELLTDVYQSPGRSQLAQLLMQLSGHHLHQRTGGQQQADFAHGHFSAANNQNTLPLQPQEDRKIEVFGGFHRSI